MSKTLRSTIVAAMAAAAVVTTAAACGSVDGLDPTSQSVRQEQPAESQQTAPKKAEPAKPKYTAAQENAIGAAEDYLEFQSFSRTGLIKQLVFEKYSKADATFAVDHIDVNWKEQAAKSAQNYLELQHFSRQGLIKQLMFEGYTKAQATHGVNTTGL